MRRIVSVLCALIIIASSSAQTVKPPVAKVSVSRPAATSGYQIPISLTPLKNCWIFLGNHFGKYKNLADSTWLNAKSEGVFSGKSKLPEGIYFIVSPNKVLLFELLMDKEQHFTIKADTSKLGNVVITGSPDNLLFQSYTRFLTEKTPVLMSLQQQISKAANAEDSARIRVDIVKANKELQDYRDGIMLKNANSMLAAFFYSMKRPEVPAIPKGAKTRADSSYPYRFVKDHWWDGVSFDNESLVRTPFFEPKLEDYFKYYVAPESDSIIAEANYMLLVSREKPEMFKYLLGKFTDKYINPEYMGQEKVFLFLFDKYFSKGDTAWLSQKQRQYIFDRAYSLMANQLGEPAADLQMLDTTGKDVSLYSLKSPFTFIAFWDPNCGHCKETVPRFDSIYKAKWKELGVQMVGVNVDDAANTEWKKFITEHKMTGWSHIYQPKKMKEEEARKGVANFRQLYDVSKTPTLYLLDAEKRIIGKTLSLEQFDDVLTAKIKNRPASKK